jgi:hypothetical protein
MTWKHLLTGVSRIGIVGGAAILALALQAKRDYTDSSLKKRELEANSEHRVGEAAAQERLAAAQERLVVAQEKGAAALMKIAAAHERMAVAGENTVIDKRLETALFNASGGNRPRNG